MSNRGDEVTGNSMYAPSAGQAAGERPWDQGAGVSANDSLSDRRRARVRASFYVLPNLITATSLFLGFLAMKMAVDGRMGHNPQQSFEWAAYALLCAAIADGLDGSVARLTRTQSQFGVQLDSLCDLVSFGVAPAFIMFQMGLHELNRIGFGVCFLFTLCGALRLARFNVMASKGKASGNFTGIPIPMAALPVCVCILAYNDMLFWTASNGYSDWAVKVAQVLTRPDVRNWTFVGIMFVLAIGMISTFEYVSTKNLRLPRKRPFRFLAFLMVCTVMLFTLELTLTLAILMLVYCLHGPFLWLFFKRAREHEEEELFALAEQEDEEHV